MSDFKVVQSKRNKHRKSKKQLKVEADRDLSPVEVDVKKLVQQIENCKSEIEISPIYTNIIELLSEAFLKKDIKEVICLGIGRISECLIAKHQFAFISIICQHFGISSIKFFDPVLSSADKSIIERLNYQVLSENTEGKYLAEQPTLFFLPHCPKQITNNLLFFNWTPEHIQNLFLICNSFKSIIESTPERFLRPNAHYILEICPFVDESEIENSFKFTDIFNDFALHSFATEKIEKASSSFWNVHPIPNYTTEDLELIQNGSD